MRAGEAVWARFCWGFMKWWERGVMALFGPCCWLSFAHCKLLSPLTLQIITAPLKPLGPSSGFGYGDGGGDTALGQWDTHGLDGRLPVEEERWIIMRWRRAGCGGGFKVCGREACRVLLLQAPSSMCASFSFFFRSFFWQKQTRQILCEHVKMWWLHGPVGH